MDRFGLLTIPDIGLRYDDIHHLRIDTIISGHGPDRLKYLDLEGKWTLSRRSVPYISAAFNHLERLNNAQGALRLLSEEPLNAVGMMGWTPSEQVKDPETERGETSVVIKTEAPLEQTVPPSPKGLVPHKSSGYARPAHQKRRSSVHERSQSPVKLTESAISITDYDKFVQYQTKDLSLKTNSKGDPGYSSADERNSLETPSPRVDVNILNREEDKRQHRVDSLGNNYRSSGHQYDISNMKPVHDNRVSDRHGRDLTVSVKDTTKKLPFRSGGYGTPHLNRKYELSPRSVGYSSASEQGSPYSRNINDVLLATYHMSKSVRNGRPHQDAKVN